VHHNQSLKSLLKSYLFEQYFVCRRIMGIFTSGECLSFFTRDPVQTDFPPHFSTFPVIILNRNILTQLLGFSNPDCYLRKNTHTPVLTEFRENRLLMDSEKNSKRKRKEMFT